MKILLKTNRFLAPAVLTIILCACSVSADDYGREIAQKECECDRMQVDLDTKRLQQMVADLKQKKFSTQLEVATETYPGKFSADSTAHAQCRAELKELENEAPQRFVHPDDRETLKNSYRAHIEAGRKEIAERRKDYSSVEKEYINLMRALPNQ
jgi:hypothetical protein